MRISTDPVSKLPAETQASPAYSEEGLALSACQGILQEHRGMLVCERYENGSLLLQVELPAEASAPARSKDSTVPVLWQSQPFA